MNDGLPNNMINGIVEDNGGNLWISTNQGISKYNIESKIFENYSMADGLQSTEYNSGAYLKSRTGWRIIITTGSAKEKSKIT